MMWKYEWAACRRRFGTGLRSDSIAPSHGYGRQVQDEAIPECLIYVSNYSRLLQFEKIQSS